MLEKSVKIFNVIQPIAAGLFFYSYFATGHPAWLAFVVIFLTFSVLASSALTFLFFGKKGPDIRGKIERGYLDLRAFRLEPASNIPRWVHLPRGCSVKLYVELVNHHLAGARLCPEKISLEVRIGSERFEGTWEHIIPGQQARQEGRTEALHDLFDTLDPHDALQQGVRCKGYLGFFVENFNRVRLHDRTVLIANVKIRLHDTLGGVHAIRGRKIRLAIEEVYFPSEFAA
jgi:hypothetical protein